MDITWYLVLSALLFAVGVSGVLLRRSPLVILLCLELMLNAGNLALLDAFFARRADRLAWVRPRGGSIGFPRLVDGPPIDRFAAELVEASGVLLLPGSQFGHAGNHFRIGFGRQNLPEALGRLILSLLYDAEKSARLSEAGRALARGNEDRRPASRAFRVSCKAGIVVD